MWLWAVQLLWMECIDVILPVFAPLFILLSLFLSFSSFLYFCFSLLFSLYLSSTLSPSFSPHLSTIPPLSVSLSLSLSLFISLSLFFCLYPAMFLRGCGVCQAKGENTVEQCGNKLCVEKNSTRISSLLLCILSHASLHKLTNRLSSCESLWKF